MRRPLLCLMLVPMILRAQVRSDRPIILNGATAADRHVAGLSNPAMEDQALNAGTLQSDAYAYAEVSGDSWSADLQPPMATLSAGARLLLHANSANAGPVTLSVNGSAPHPVVNAEDLALAPGAISAGSTVSVVYDGNAFQLISARRLERKPCPSGTTAVNQLYCIETTEHDTAIFRDAVVVCGSAGMKLCSWGQFYVACVNTGTLGISDLTGNWEWTDSAGNSDHSVRVVGQSSCTHSSVSVYTAAAKFHCCFRR